MKIKNGKFSLFGHGLLTPIKKETGSILYNKYIIPPFSILDARSGHWQDRKRNWIACGIKSELGRESMAEIAHKFNNTNSFAEAQKRLNRNARKYGTSFTFKEDTGSIFDPTLCELIYTWFCPKEGTIIDPFAGGSVRGIVAGLLGYNYWGCDLRQEQINANEEQKNSICPDSSIQWVCGDALEKLKDAPSADLIFTCPPYGDLERYSEDPRDLSNMSYEDMMKTFDSIIQYCFQKNKSNSFACFVLGEFRDKKGNYHGFIADMIKIFQANGYHFYNEMVLIQPVGSLALRITNQFEKSKKIGKSHQNVLVFKKE